MVEGFYFVRANAWHQVGLAALILSQLIILLVGSQLKQGIFTHAPLVLLVVFFLTSVTRSKTQHERHVVFFFSVYTAVACWILIALVYYALA